MNDNRQIRVFISSTFRDMMRERDLLVKEVFPELRRKCAKRFVTFTEVDLRWGITEAQANEGQVLPLCLAEIQRSRPYFIGLLGERYGWIPDTIRPGVIAREPWLQEHVQGRTSVTELEILHGVLNNPKMQSHALFYFRDPAYVNDPALTDGERCDMVERDIYADVERYGPAEATRRTEERKAKLATLKKRIRETKLPVAEPYPNPRALARLIRRQFNRLIDRLYPEEQAPNPLTQERMAHEAHAKNKLFACIDRPAHLAALNAFAAIAEHDSKGFVVTGESGGGKTTLLAAWARDWEKNHPEDFLFQHYFGATPDSASSEGFLRRLLGEIKMQFGITDDIPTDSGSLPDALASWLAQTVGKGRIVLVLDGLNQVQGSESDRYLFFLPKRFPSHVVALASALQSPALDELCKRDWINHELPRAGEFEVDQMVGEYLRIHARTLETRMRHELVTASGAKNPLFLRTVLEELRQFGSFEQLPQRIRHYLQSQNPNNLFLRVLDRWQEDFDGKNPERDKSQIDLVRRALSHLWAARKGVSESEWLNLLGDDTQPLPRALWTPLFLALEPHLSQRAGLYAFGHDFLRQAVETAFVPSDALQKAAHHSIANYFKRQNEITTRKLEELPWQCSKACLFDDLEKILTDVDMFLGLSDLNRYEIWNYWQVMPTQKRAFVEAYTKAQEKWKKVLGETTRFELALNELVHFYFISGEQEESAKLTHVSYELAKSLYSEDDIRFAIRTNNIANASYTEKKYSEAVELLLKAKPAYEREFTVHQVDRWVPLNNLGMFLSRLGRLEEAEQNLRSAVAGCRKYLGGKHEFALTSILNLARILQFQGKFSEATPLFEEAASGRKTVLGEDHPTTEAAVALLNEHLRDYVGESADTCLINLARLLEAIDLNEHAIRCYQKALNILESESAPEHDAGVILCARNLSVLLADTGDANATNKTAVKLIRADRGIYSGKFPKSSNGCRMLEVFFRNNNRPDIAEPLLKWSLQIEERTQSHGNEQSLAEENESAIAVSSLGAKLRNKGRLSDAEPLFRRALLIDERNLGESHPKIPHRLNNLCTVLVMTSRLSEATKMLARAWRLKSGQHDLTSTRLLFVSLTIALLNSQPTQTFVGLLKTLLALESLPDHADVVKILDIAYFIEFLKPKLGEHNAELLTALVAALNDRTKLPALDSFSEWRDQSLIPLDASWPE